MKPPYTLEELHRDRDELIEAYREVQESLDMARKRIPGIASRIDAEGKRVDTLTADALDMMLIAESVLEEEEE